MKKAKKKIDVLGQIEAFALNRESIGVADIMKLQGVEISTARKRINALCDAGKLVVVREQRRNDQFPQLWASVANPAARTQQVVTNDEVLRRYAPQSEWAGRAGVTRDHLVAAFFGAPGAARRGMRA